MTVIAAIVSFLRGLLGSSVFGDAMHALMTEFGLANDQAKYDAMVTAAQDMLTAGASITQAVDNLLTQFDTPAHHAMVAAAAAQASVSAASAPKAGA